jgi:histidine triad (HIT) family protein
MIEKKPVDPGSNPGNPICDIMDCIFCKIVKGEIPCYKIYEDEKILAFLDIQPINLGHTLIIPKKHAELIAELEDELVGEIFKVAKKINIALRKSEVNCKGINFQLADGESAGQEVPHVHVHVIPRYKDDGFGLKFPLNYENKPSKEELENIAEKIRKSF